MRINVVNRLLGIFIFSSYNYSPIYPFPAPCPQQMWLAWLVCHCNSISEGRHWATPVNVEELHLKKYFWALHTSASDGITTHTSTWNWASMALFLSDSAPRDSVACHLKVSKVREGYVALLWVARQTSTYGHLEQQSWTTAAGSVNQSSLTWKHNRTISKTIDRITDALQVKFCDLAYSKWNPISGFHTTPRTPLFAVLK